jgi:hypothetical protein
MATSKNHEHNFMHCGTDEQQCDSACRATSHLCSICGKNRQEAAKEPDEVRAHVVDSAREIIKSLEMALRLPLPEAVEAIQECSKELDWLSREQLVEMAVWDAKHGHGRATVR